MAVPSTSSLGWKSFFRSQTWLFLFFWLLAMGLLRSSAFEDPGSLWHIRVGDWIWDHGRIMQTDPFTFTFTGHPWRPQQWAGECLISLLHRLGGLDALLLALAVLLAGFASWLAGRFIRAGLHPVLAAALVLLGLIVASFHFYIRPHMATIVFMGWVMGRIVDFESGRITWKQWAWLVPVTIVWTNLHGGVLGGLATVGLAGAGWALLALMGRESPIKSWRILIFLILILAISGIALLVNPYGFGMLKIWNSIVDSKLLPQIVTEHQPVRLSNLNGLAVVGFGAFYILMLASTLPKWPHVSWLIPLVWFGLSLHSIRHGPLFCVVALVSLADMFPNTIWFRWLQKHGDTLVRREVTAGKNGEERTWLAWLIPAALTILCLWLQAVRLQVPLLGSGWVWLNPKEVPVDLLEPLQEYARNKPEGTPVFNDANFGGFLIYFTPKLRIFMDDRCELYGDPWMADYMDMMKSHPERIEEHRAKYGFDRALVTVDSPMDRYLGRSLQWREVARGQKAVLYAWKEN